MNQTDRNIYRICRAKTGLTQEAWAERLGLSVESIRRYELGQTRPEDDVVRDMMLESGYDTLAYQHILSSTRKLQVLPEVRTDIPVERAALQAINCMGDFFDGHQDRDLLRIVEDGVIDENEKARFDSIMQAMERMASAYFALRYAIKEVS